MASFLPWLPWLLAALLSVYLLDLLAHSRRLLPPGPRPLPLIGSLHLLGDQPHRSLAGLAKMYGPLMSLRLGAVTTVVVSSPDVAREFLQRHNAAFASRSVPDATGDHATNSVAWLPNSPRWRALRRIMAAELFAPHRLDALRRLRREKVQELVDHVARLAEREGGAAAVDVGRVAFATSLNLLSSTIFSRNLTSLDDHGESMEFKEVVVEIMEAGGCPNVSDFFPAIAAADLQGWRRRMAGLFARLHRVFDAVVEERLSERDAGEARKGDFLDVLLDVAARDNDSAGLDRDTLRSLFTARPCERLVRTAAREAGGGRRHVVRRAKQAGAGATRKGTGRWAPDSGGWRGGGAMEGAWLGGEASVAGGREGAAAGTADARTTSRPSRPLPDAASAVRHGGRWLFVILTIIDRIRKRTDIPM
uniref:Cytochrome P-450 n=1 Tax=Oryza sativa subsp. japonica TaxID=39947 RepID=Q94HM8_ORYSJ|nr:Putative cytochrome P-450 [Oryza sativa Japonica Group]